MDKAREQKVIDAVPTGVFIGGTWRDATGGHTFEVEDPSTGRPLCTCAAPSS